MNECVSVCVSVCVCGVQPFLGRTFALLIDMLTNIRTGKIGIKRPLKARKGKR